MSKARLTTPKEGDERYLLEQHPRDRVMALAKERGHPGDDSSVMDYCEPAEAAIYVAYPSLEAATDAGKSWVAAGKDFWGCGRIEHQRFERFQRDMRPEWECQRGWYVDETGIVEEFSA